MTARICHMISAKVPLADLMRQNSKLILANGKPGVGRFYYQALKI
jgi:hypothetical protein